MLGEAATGVVSATSAMLEQDPEAGRRLAAELGSVGPHANDHQEDWDHFKAEEARDP